MIYRLASTFAILATFCLSAKCELMEAIWGAYRQIPISDVESAKWRQQDYVKDGWDWSLPPDTPLSKNAFFSIFRTWSPRDITKLKNLPKLKFKCNPMVEHWVRWRDIEKSEGVYDFEFLRQMIDAAAERGYSSSVRLLTAARQFAPRYFENLDIKKLDASGGDFVESYDPADPEFHKRYLKLVEAFAESKIAKMDAVQGIYIGYASPSFGDEGIGPENPDSHKHVKERLNAWAEALRGVENKAYMGGWSDFGISKGFGIRRGFVEIYLYHIPDQQIGQALDAQGYLTSDENNPLIKSGAIHGEENEEYESRWATAETNYRFGRDTSSFQYRYFCSTLRLLQMRCNRVLWNNFTLNSEFYAWAALELGKSASDAPDAWCFLRESYLKPYYSKKPVKNLERWLFQRDAEGFETKAEIKIEHAAKMWMVDKPWDFAARSGKKIGFFAARDFIFGKSQSVVFKITFWDERPGRFLLCISENGKRREIAIECPGSKKLKTASIRADADFGMSGKFDFTLEALGDSTPPIIFVRLIKAPRKES